MEKIKNGQSVKVNGKNAVVTDASIGVYIAVRMVSEDGSLGGCILVSASEIEAL